MKSELQTLRGALKNKDEECSLLAANYKRREESHQVTASLSIPVPVPIPVLASILFVFFEPTGPGPVGVVQREPDRAAGVCEGAGRQEPGAVPREQPAEAAPRSGRRGLQSRQGKGGAAQPAPRAAGDPAVHQGGESVSQGGREWVRLPRDRSGLTVCAAVLCCVLGRVLARSEAGLQSEGRVRLPAARSGQGPS